MNNKEAIVVDLGSTKVVCLAAVQTESGEVRAEAWSQVGCRGVRKGIVLDIDETSAAIDEAVSRVEKSVGRSVDEIAVSVAGAHLQSVNAQGFVPIYPNTRPVRRDDVLAVINHSRQIVMPSDREQIMAVPREFRVDGQRGVQRPIGMSGGRLEVVTHLVTGQSSLIDLVDRAVTLSGRKVLEMVPQPLASGLGVATADTMEEGCAVIDVGGGTTDVAVFSGGAVAHLASIPVGAHHVTTDLAALLKVSLDEAERLKTTYGSASSRDVPENERVQVQQTDQPEPRPMQRRVLCEIVESRMREIVGLAVRQIEASGLAGSLRGGVTVTGGGSLLPGTAALFSDALGSRVQNGSPKVAGPNARTLDVPTMSTAVGLAKYCLESDDQEFAPVSGFANWKDKIRTLKNPFNRKGQETLGK
ncbi:MAG: cell division protein FtsA [Armatimonadetes bacterium]|nr:cell division protein FtsA [Armatimonadota bacterium]